jgi:ABC-type molybdate transport system substrate-binding protein
VNARTFLSFLTLSALVSCGEKPTSTAPLTVYCAAALKVPMEAIAKDYQTRYQIPVQLQFGPSQTLLSNAKVTSLGDLFLPADDSFITMAEAQGLTSTQVPLASQTAVLVVAKGNPKGIKDLASAAAARLVLSNPDAAAIGQILRKKLPSETWTLLSSKATSTLTTVTDAANALQAGAADATFIWDAMLSQYPGFEAVPLPELQNLSANVTLALLKNSREPAAAMRFARFVAAKDTGLSALSKHGFKVVEGDPWSEKPELTLYAGSMLRPAIEKTITDFEQREGVAVTRVYNGCGILVGQMQAGQTPDAYFACDVEFMKQVQEQFESPDSIAQNQLVILVKKGNPFGIADLKDLTKPGLRVGIGHEKQCAMGWLTQRTFTEGKVTESVMKNVVAQVPTGDMLVNSMLAGSLDAAVVYLSNAVGAGDKLDAVAIQGIECAIATQPFAIKKGTPYKQMMERLHAQLRSAESKSRFEEEGFKWQGEK